jgi:hypothetical protein
MGRHKHPLYGYHYFEETTEKDCTNRDIHVVLCAIDGCSHKWSFPTDKRMQVSQLNTHMRTKHPALWSKYSEWIHTDMATPLPLFLANDTSTNPVRTTSNTSTVSLGKRTHNSSTAVNNTSSDRELEEGVLESLTTFMSICNIPLRIVTNDSFRQLIDSIRLLRSPYAISIPSIRASTIQQSADLRGLLYERLKAPYTYVTLAFDGWTNCNGVKITNVMAISKGTAYYIKSIPNASDFNTATWLEQHIQPVVDDLILHGIKINAFVTDNGSTETSVRDRLSFIYNITSIPCAAHTLQLIVRFILKKHEVNDVVSFFDGIINSFTNNKPLRLKLKEHTSLRLRKSNATRWNSVYLMMIRLKQMKDAINAVGVTDEEVRVGNDRWTALDDISTVACAVCAVVYCAVVYCVVI